MTFTLLEVVAGITCLAVVAGVIAFARLTHRLSGTAREIEYAARRVSALTPAVQSLIDDGRSQLEELRSLTHNTSQIVGDVQAVTGEASAATVNVVRLLEDRVVGRSAAIIAGARAGLNVLRRARGGNGSESDERSETDERRIGALAD